MRYIEKLWSVRYSLTLLVVLQAFDVLSTKLALAAGAQEANPVIEQGMEAAGASFLFWAKQGVILLVFLAIWIDSMEKPYVHAALVIMNVVYVTVIAGNFLAYGQYTGEWHLPVAYWALAVAIAVAAIDHVWFSGRRVAPQQA